MTELVAAAFLALADAFGLHGSRKPAGLGRDQADVRRFRGVGGIGLAPPAGGEQAVGPVAHRAGFRGLLGRLGTGVFDFPNPIKAFENIKLAVRRWAERLLDRLHQLRKRAGQEGDGTDRQTEVFSALRYRLAGKIRLQLFALQRVRSLHFERKTACSLLSCVLFITHIGSRQFSARCSLCTPLSARVDQSRDGSDSSGGEGTGSAAAMAEEREGADSTEEDIAGDSLEDGVQRCSCWGRSYIKHETTAISIVDCVKPRQRMAALEGNPYVRDDVILLRYMHVGRERTTPREP